MDDVCVCISFGRCEYASNCMHAAVADTRAERSPLMRQVQVKEKKMKRKGEEEQ